MSDVTAEALISIAHQYYPVGFPPETDTFTHAPDPYQQTPEYRRWQDAWAKAIEAEPWRAVLHDLRPRFPDLHFGTYTPAYMSGGYACILYLRRPRLDGREGYRLIRVAAAISLLAPLYFVYGTVEEVTPIPPEERVLWKRLNQNERFGRTQLVLRPSAEMQPYADVLARHVEHTFSHRPFPLELAQVAIPDARVPYLNLEPATLMNAFFFQDLSNLV
ncbi:hypothetical protein ACLESO_16950 [Pyxidicoccus sp. 3LG]